MGAWRYTTEGCKRVFRYYDQVGAPEHVRVVIDCVKRAGETLPAAAAAAPFAAAAHGQAAKPVPSIAAPMPPGYSMMGRIGGQVGAAAGWSAASFAGLGFGGFGGPDRSSLSPSVSAPIVAAGPEGGNSSVAPVRDVGGSEELPTPAERLAFDVAMTMPLPGNDNLPAGDTVPVPEPGTLGLLAIGVAVALMVRR